MTKLFASATRQQTPLETALKSSATAFALVFAYSCGYNLFLLTPSVYLLQIYDRVLSSRSVDTLVMLTLIVCVAVVVGTLLDIVRRAALSRIGSWLEGRLRPAVLASAFEYATKTDASRAAECYRHLAGLRQFLDSPSSALLFDLPWAPVFLGLLFMVHPLLGVIGAASALFLLFFALCGEWATRAPAAEAASAFSRGFSRFSSALKYGDLVRAMGMQEGALRLVDSEAEIVRAGRDHVASRAEVVQAFSKSTRALTQIVMMGVACWLVLAEDASPGIIFVACLLLGRGLAPIEGTIGAWKGLVAARHACDALNEMFVVTDRRHAAPLFAATPTGRLVLDNVGYGLPGRSRPILSGVSLALNGGDCVALIGASGSGKSTLGRIIAGIARPTVGAALLDGWSIADLRDHGETGHIGYLPQDIELFGGTIRDVIGRFDGSDHRKIVDAARLSGLHETIVRLPKGYETDVGEGGAMLLRAERQRLGLARAVYGRPSLIVLDDPNSSLDYGGERMLFDLIGRLRQSGATVVIITHRMGILPATNKIAILKNGTLSAFGDSEFIYETHLRAKQKGVA